MRSSFSTILLLYHVLSIWNFLILTCTIYILAPGFRKDEVEEYMRLVLEGETTRERRMRMLEERRVEALDEIHRKEQKLERLDYLRFQMKKEQEMKKSGNAL